jgi:hypothetical protein
MVEDLLQHRELVREVLVLHRLVGVVEGELDHTVFHQGFSELVRHAQLLLAGGVEELALDRIVGYQVRSQLLEQLGALVLLFGSLDLLEQVTDILVLSLE